MAFLIPTPSDAAIRHDALFTLLFLLARCRKTARRCACAGQKIARLFTDAPSFAAMPLLKSVQHARAATILPAMKQTNDNLIIIHHARHTT